MINSMGGAKPYEPSSGLSGAGADVSALTKEKAMLEKQLENVKSKPKNSPAEQDAAEKQKLQLEKKIANLEMQIQTLSERGSENKLQNVGKVGKVNNNELHDVDKSKNEDQKHIEGGPGENLDVYS